MSKNLVIALSTALLGAGSLHAQTTTPPVTTPPAWITRSNADAHILLDVIARFSPEAASQFGLAGFDEKVADLQPNADARSRAAMVEGRGKLQQLVAAEKDANVRQDLQIMIKAADNQIEGVDLNDKYMLPFNDVGQLVFNGEFALLQKPSTANVTRRR